MRKPSLFVALVGLGLCLGAAGHAQPAAQPSAQPPAQPSAQPGSLVERLRQAVQASGLGEQVGVSVVDVASGRPVFQHHAERPLNPASNMKLVTAAAALRVLGADFTMRTSVHGRLEGDRVVGGLALRGSGDPTLGVGELYALARQVADQGVRSCDHVIVDATYFDEQVLPDAFEQQPNEVAPFRAPIGAIAIERNAYELRILPGGAVGQPAIVRLLGAGYFELDNQLTTSEPGAPRVIADQRDGGSRMQLRLRGTVPLGVRGVSYRRRIESPLPWAGHAFLEALRAAGVRCGDRVEIGPAPSGASTLASHESQALATMLPAMGKWSDNFTAEMVFRVLGAERHQPGRAEDAVAAVRASLEEAGLAVDRITIVNGSGLFQGNRIASQQLADLLAAMYRDPRVRDEYVAHLAIGGVDGTLRNRLRDLPMPRVVRAKTGTLNDVIALSGYVLGPAPDRAYAFSFLANGVTGRQGAARELGDSIARALAQDLHR